MSQPPRQPPHMPGPPPGDSGHTGMSHLFRRLARSQDAALGAAKGRPLKLTDSRPGLLATIQDRRRRDRRTMVLASFGTAVATAIFLVAVNAPVHFQLDMFGARSGAPADVGQPLLADAQSDLPLRFADGSTVTFLAGSAGRLQRLTGSGAEVVIERGRLEAHVVHAATTLWLVHAGPFKVRVTGTRFEVGWSAARFDVAVYEGSVMVEGAVLGAGVSLRAGQRLTIEAGVVRTLALSQAPRSSLSDAEPGKPAPTPAPPSPDSPLIGTEPPSAATPPEASGESAARMPAAESWRDADWLLAAERGDYREAMATAKNLGWGGLCHRLDARRLLILGDVARYAGMPTEARRAFAALVARFPTDPRAADGMFSLGRLAFEAGHVDRAAHWFKRYVDDWPNGPLADQAAGRLVECAVRSEDPDTAESAARAYLDRAPNGPHAGLARQVLEKSAAPQP